VEKSGQQSAGSGQRSDDIYVRIYN
jgi:hypothetical protein